MRKKILLPLVLVSIYATAMGYLEATVVDYIRKGLPIETMTSALTPEDVALNLGVISFLGKSIIDDPVLLLTEQFREAATIIMLACVGWLASRRWMSRIAYFMLAFAIWDLSYYVFLYVLLNWPTSLLTIDIYFLIPVPWVGPVITPVIACSILIVVAAYLLRLDNRRYA